jgi:predicted acylesterase/phospholipase RssA
VNDVQDNQQDNSSQTIESQARGLPGQIVLVLEGGGALGSYQAGVYQALHEAGIEPDWIIGTSIGAINASLIAGNVPPDRLLRLEEFWKRMEQDPIWKFREVFPGSTIGCPIGRRSRAAFPDFSGRTRLPMSATVFRSVRSLPAIIRRRRWRRH